MKAAVYCRLSEEDRNKSRAGEDSGSIQNQKAMLLQYAKEQGWDVYDIYSDDDYTGTDRNRPEFCRLLQDAQLGRFHIVLCKTLSRFTRELELVEKYIHGLFPLWGIRFISIVDNADTADKGNKKARQINGLINEWYLEDMSENIRSVLKNRRENGYHTGAFALYGYRKDPDRKGHLIIDPEAAAIVREVFSLFSKGYGKTAIARILNSRGIPNPTEYKHLQGLRYRQPEGRTSSLWSYSAISHMLTNEIYIGNMVQGKYGSISYKTKKNRPRPKSEWIVVPGTHEPIIDRELWDQVQALILQKTKPFQSGTVGLFAGKARCAGCGRIMRSTSSRGRRYLQCPTRHLSDTACSGAFISVNRLEQLVREELSRLTDLYLNLAEVRQQTDLSKPLLQEQTALLSSLSSCEKQTAEYDRGLGQLYMDRARGILPERDFAQLQQDFFSRREQLELSAKVWRRRLQELEKKIPASESVQQDLLRQYTHPEQLDREIVTVMIDYISVGRRIPGTRTVPVEIHWNF